MDCIVLVSMRTLSIFCDVRYVMFVTFGKRERHICKSIHQMMDKSFFRPLVATIAVCVEELQARWLSATTVLEISIYSAWNHR